MKPISHISFKLHDFPNLKIAKLLGTAQLESFVIRFFAQNMIAHKWDIQFMRSLIRNEFEWALNCSHEIKPEMSFGEIREKYEGRMSRRELGNVKIIFWRYFIYTGITISFIYLHSNNYAHEWKRIINSAHVLLSCCLHSEILVGCF